MKKQWKQFIMSVLLVTILTGCADNAEYSANGNQNEVSQEQISEETDSGQENLIAGESEAGQSTLNRIESAGNTENSGAMEVHFLDVGQGDATLVMNGDSVMLIDAGDNSAGTTVQMYLQKRGIEHLDYLVLTHTDSDHIGGADVVLTKFEVDTVFMGDYAKDTAAYRDVIQALDDKGLSWSTPEAGNVYELGDATFTIIAPNGSYSDPNNSSVGLLLEKSDTRFLFTGDAEEEAEGEIVQNGLSLQADVYQVGHHGSRTSTTEELLDAMNPTYAVISCAEGNDYGHPNAQTLNRLRERGIQVFRTDEQGSIVAIVDGEGITWNCAPSDSWIAGEPKGSANSQVSVGSQDSITNEQTGDNQDSSAVNVSDATQSTYICNTSTGKFHFPCCSSASQIAEKNKLESNATREELVTQGYEPCKRCNP